MIERPFSEWIRRVRKPVSTSGAAYRSDGACLRVHMTNLSYDGCRLLTEHRLDIGETLRLVMPRMQEMDVQVRWVKEGEAGVRFLQNATARDDRRARIGV